MSTEAAGWHNRSCGACSADAGDDVKHALVRVVAKIAVSLREREFFLIFATTGIVRDGKEHPARFHRKGVVGSL
jgi:hypothetical protein